MGLQIENNTNTVTTNILCSSSMTLLVIQCSDAMTLLAVLWCMLCLGDWTRNECVNDIIDSSPSFESCYLSQQTFDRHCLCLCSSSRCSDAMTLLHGDSMAVL
eukprot:501030_1